MPNIVTMHESNAMLPVEKSNPIFEDATQHSPFQPTLKELQKAIVDAENAELQLIAEQAQNDALRDANKRLAGEIETLQAQALLTAEDLQHQADKISELNAHLTASRKALGEQTQRLHELQALYMRMSAQVLMALEAAQEKEYEQSLQKEL